MYNKINNQFVFAFLSFFVSFILFSQTLDQSATSVTLGTQQEQASSPAYKVIGQSFVAGITGNLSKFSIYNGFFTPHSIYELKVYSGVGNSGELLGTQLFELKSSTATGEYAINITTTTIPLVSGNVYTAFITLANNSYFKGFGVFMGDSYSSGVSWLRYQDSFPLASNSDVDMWFKTHVSPAADHLSFHYTEPGQIGWVSQQVKGADYLTLPLGNSNYTIETWFKRSENSHVNLVQWGDTFAFSANKINRLSLTSSGVTHSWGFNDLNIPYNFALNTWYHIAATYNGAVRTIYVDGVAIGSDTPAGVHDVTHNPLFGYTFSIGQFLKGAMDDFRIWNIAKTATEINASRNCELTGTETGLKTYYKFNQGNAELNNAGITTLNNSVSGGPNAVLDGFALSGVYSNWVSGSPVATGSFCSSLAVNSFDVLNKVSVYPNPTQNTVNIDLRQLSNAKLEVYDLAGSLIMNQNLNKVINSVDISRLPIGLYVFKLFSSEGNGAVRILKK